MTDEEIDNLILAATGRKVAGVEGQDYIHDINAADLRRIAHLAIAAERAACAQFVAWQGAALTIKASHESEQGNGYCAENLDEAAKQMKATAAAIRKRGEHEKK